MLLICIKSLQSVTESYLCHHFNPIGMKVKALHFLLHFYVENCIFSSTVTIFFFTKEKFLNKKKSHFNSLVTESKNKTYTSCSERVFPKKKTALKFCTLDILRISTTWYFLWRFFFITCKGTIIINMLFLLQTNLHKIFWHTKHVSYLIALKNIMSISFSFAICYKIQYICRKNYFGFHEIHFQAVKVISVWVYHGSFCE